MGVSVVVWGKMGEEIEEGVKHGGWVLWEDWVEWYTRKGERVELS
jgi:hypothetical protein